MTDRPYSAQSGLSLIELLVAIAVVALIAGSGTFILRATVGSLDSVGDANKRISDLAILSAVLRDDILFSSVEFTDKGVLDTDSLANKSDRISLRRYSSPLVIQEDWNLITWTFFESPDVTQLGRSKIVRHVEYYNAASNLLRSEQEVLSGEIETLNISAKFRHFETENGISSTSVKDSLDLELVSLDLTWKQGTLTYLLRVAP